MWFIPALFQFLWNIVCKTVRSWNSEEVGQHNKKSNEVPCDTVYVYHGSLLNAMV